MEAGFRLLLEFLKLAAKKLTGIRGCCEVDGEESTALDKAIHLLETASDYVKSKITSPMSAQVKQLLSVEWNLEVETPLCLLSWNNRKLIKEGAVKFHKKSAYVYLFNDLCIIAEKTPTNTLKFIRKIYLHQVGLSEWQGTKFSLLMDGKEDDAEQLTFRSKDEAQHWYKEFDEITESFVKNRVFGTELKQTVLKEQRPSKIPVVMELSMEYLLKNGINS